MTNAGASGLRSLAPFSCPVTGLVTSRHNIPSPTNPVRSDPLNPRPDRHATSPHSSPHRRASPTLVHPYRQFSSIPPPPRRQAPSAHSSSRPPSTSHRRPHLAPTDRPTPDRSLQPARQVHPDQLTSYRQAWSCLHQHPITSRLLTSDGSSLHVSTHTDMSPLDRSTPARRVSPSPPLTDNPAHVSSSPNDNPAPVDSTLLRQP